MNTNVVGKALLGVVCTVVAVISAILIIIGVCIESGQHTGMGYAIALISLIPFGLSVWGWIYNFRYIKTLFAQPASQLSPSYEKGDIPKTADELHESDDEMYAGNISARSDESEHRDEPESAPMLDMSLSPSSDDIHQVNADHHTPAEPEITHRAEETTDASSQSSSVRGQDDQARLNAATDEESYRLRSDDLDVTPSWWYADEREEPTFSVGHDDFVRHEKESKLSETPEPDHYGMTALDDEDNKADAQPSSEESHGWFDFSDYEEPSWTNSELESHEPNKPQEPELNTAEDDSQTEPASAASTTAADESSAAETDVIKTKEKPRVRVTAGIQIHRYDDK